LISAIDKLPILFLVIDFVSKIWKVHLTISFHLISFYNRRL